MNSSRYTPIIGLEVHVEPKTKSKMFCNCDAEHFRVTPNTHTCPVCLGLPGALPVPNRKAISYTQMIGLALNCQLAKQSKFDRKNYFYPDLPKAFQISQYDQPLCYNGQITLENGKTIGITRVHMEEDTAKNSHQNGKTLIDFNRSGVPLAEIVTEPDFRNAKDVDLYLKQIQQTIRYLGVSDCDMEKGSMRLEVNMSLATKDMFDINGKIIKFPQYKVEIKNINSFRYAQNAIKYEFKRQSQLLDRGIIPEQETRGWQEKVGKTISQRNKEDAQDYRYFPAPDIPPMEFNSSDFDQLKSLMPELPKAKKERFISEYSLRQDLAEFLTNTKELANYFEQTIIEARKHKLDIAEVAKTLKNKNYDWHKLTPKQLVKKLLQNKKEIISDENTIVNAVNKVLQANPEEVERYNAGENKLMGFFMGQIMRELKGKGDAKVLQQILKDMIN